MGGRSSAIEEECQRRADRIRTDLQLRINDFRKHQQEEFSSIPSDKKQIIKEATATELTQLMDSGKITSYEATLTFIERTATIGVRMNYVIEEMFEEAITRAKECDQIRKENPGKKCWRFGESKEDTLPPFFGVPISINDNILYPGKISYIGHVHPINPIPEQPSELILLIRKMGLIPFVKSSSPQSNKTLQTNNNILGYAKNPWDETRTCGGSSGGEGGLLGSHCSPIGLGSDIAGSGRITSEFNGLVTLKPYYRYSNNGNAYSGSFSAGLFLRTETTIMSRSVQDVIIFNQFMYDKGNYSDIPRKLKDPYLRLSSFNDRGFKQNKKYKIGYFTQFKGNLKCSPSHRRAVLEALRIAESNGHHTEQIQIKQGQRMMLNMTRLWFSSPQLELLNELRRGEKPIPEYQKAYQYAKVPTWMKRSMANVLMLTQPRLAALIRCTIPYSITEYFTILHQFNEIRKELYQYLKNKEIDAIICPGFFMPPFRLGTAEKFSYCSAFTMIWSILFYAAGAMPITTVRQDQQYFQDFYKDEIFSSISESMKGTEGLPVGIQVVSYPGKEEEVLQIMKQIEDKVAFRQNNKSSAFHLIE